MSEAALQTHENGEKKATLQNFFVTLFGLLLNFKKEPQFHFLIYIFPLLYYINWALFPYIFLGNCYRHFWHLYNNFLRINVKILLLPNSIEAEVMIPILFFSILFPTFTSCSFHLTFFIFKPQDQSFSSASPYHPPTLAQDRNSVISNMSIGMLDPRFFLSPVSHLTLAEHCSPLLNVDWS